MSEVWEKPRTKKNWCSKHGFYDCPVCKGLEPVWVIPIMEGPRQTGELRLSEGEAVVTGSARPPVMPLEPSEPRVVVHEHVVYVHPVSVEASSEPAVPPVVTAPLDLDAARELIEKIGSTSHAKMMEEPRHREAAARGRAIHDKAIELSEAEGIPYADAIKRIVGEP